MLKKIKFTKMVAAGNDFVVIDHRLQTTDYSLKSFVQQICDRKLGVGADGVLLLEKSKKADVRMRIFNADGSEADMCGNGARCAALFNSKVKTKKSKIGIETKAGIILSQISGDDVKIRLTDPKDIKFDLSVKLGYRVIRVNFINTGVPHVVIFAEGLDKIDVRVLGREIRFHQKFAPAGTNVNFVEVLKPDSIKVRTYERGVEDETLACGTGSTASALVFALKSNFNGVVNVFTQSKEVLKVSFTKEGRQIGDVWLEGKAKIVYKGEYHV